jgi:alkanesulfonate monooxygenase SsuD/methylene tetrahydromethanopterin reductase-like flavin-dependent oxidoreductase (luciferase family)
MTSVAGPAAAVAARWPGDTTRSFGYMVGRPSRDAVEQLEDAGADSLWVPGHISSPNPGPEAITSLAQLSAISTRAVVGTAILLLPLYAPAIVAKQVAEIDQFSGGRTVLGVGVGGEYASDFSACQISPKERGGRADEAIPLLHALWKGEAVSNDGPFFSMTDARVHPSPAQLGGPPILVAGRKGRTMRRAGTLGDGWFPYQYSPRAYARSVAEIRAHGGAAGRDLEGFVWALWTYVNVNDDGNRARQEMFESMQRYPNIDDPAMVDHITVAGTPNEVDLRLREYIDAGVDHFVFVGVGAEQQLMIQRDLVPGLRTHRRQ